MECSSNRDWPGLKCWSAHKVYRSVHVRNVKHSPAKTIQTKAFFNVEDDR